MNYMNSKYGNIHIELLPDGTVVLRQTSVDGMVNTLHITTSEMEKMARMLFAKKKEYAVTPFTPVTNSSNPVSANGTVSSGSYMAQQKLKHPNAYKPWTLDEEKWLKTMVSLGYSVADIAVVLGRNEGAIISRLIKLGIVLK